MWYKSRTINWWRVLCWLLHRSKPNQAYEFLWAQLFFWVDGWCFGALFFFLIEIYWLFSWCVCCFYVFCFWIWYSENVTNGFFHLLLRAAIFEMLTNFSMFGFATSSSGLSQIFYNFPHVTVWTVFSIFRYFRYFRYFKLFKFLSPCNPFNLSNVSRVSSLFIPSNAEKTKYTPSEFRFLFYFSIRSLISLMTVWHAARNETFFTRMEQHEKRNDASDANTKMLHFALLTRTNVRNNTHTQHFYCVESLITSVQYLSTVRRLRRRYRI